MRLTEEAMEDVFYADHPRESSVLEIKEALEGPLGIVECVYSRRTVKNLPSVLPGWFGISCKKNSGTPYLLRHYNI